MMATPDQTQPTPAPTRARARTAARRCRRTSAIASTAAPAVALREWLPPTSGDVVEVAPAAARPADVSPLAAVIGIALLGGMLLIGVLIGRSGSDDKPTPAPIVQVDPGQTTTATTRRPATPPPATGAVTTDWPTDAQGFTIQLSLVPKDGATQDSRRRAPSRPRPRRVQRTSGVLDSDLYPSLTPGNYVDLLGHLHRAPARGRGPRQARRRLSRRHRDRGSVGPQGDGDAGDRAGGCSGHRRGAVGPAEDEGAAN